MRSCGQIERSKTLPELLIADFVVSTPAERDARVDAALTWARAKASVQGKRGILVTRLSLRRFSVALSPNVPYGYTHELDQS